MRKTFLLTLLCISLLSVNSQPPYTPVKDSAVLAFIADTQAPMWVETLFLKSHNNRAATKKIFNELSIQKPKALFLLGDVVNLGYSKKQWRSMDAYLKDLRSQGITVHAALGNHEVMGRAKKGEQKFQSYFPDHVRTGYVQVVDSVAVVLLNSNFGKLDKHDDAAQVIWYKDMLQKLDADSSVHFVITGCHHSPFTNSKVVKCSKDVEGKFVQPFLQSGKSRLFLSGHSHNFEHFQKEGKDFLVIGGGGGLHQPVKTGTDVLADLATDYKPFFHYLTVKRFPDFLEIKSFQLSKDFSQFSEGKKLIVKKESRKQGSELATAN